MKRRPNIALLVFALLIVGCASKKARPPGLEPGAARKDTAPDVIDPNSGEKVAVRPAHEGVTVVLGGAGVASFATVGIFKALEQERVPVDRIIVTGWPAIFAFGYGTLKSIHDLEWFALRLNQKDFYKKGLFDRNQGFHGHAAIKARLKKAFGNKDLRKSRVPIHVMVTETRRFRTEEITEGAWHNAILKAISAPGIYQPFPPTYSRAGILALEGINVERAVELAGKNVLAFAMYEDYVRFLNKPGSTSEALFRQVFGTNLKNNYLDQMKLTPLSARIPLRRPPNDFKSKRAAIHAGFKAARRLIQRLE